MRKRVYVNLDADEGIFFERELKYIKSRSYDVLYPELLARRLFPVASEADTGAATITYQSWDHVGMAKLIHQYSQDIPNIEITAKETTRKIYSEAVAFGYSLQEVRNARYAGKPLQQRKASAARRQVLYLENRLAFFGDPESDIPPFVGNSLFNQVTIPAGVSTNTEWDTKTPDEIINDVTLMTKTIRDVSNGVESPNTLLLPEAQYTQISTTPRSSTSDTTILTFLLNSNAWIQEIIPVYELKGAGAGGTDTMILYDKSPDKLTLEIPQDVEFLPPQEKGFMFEILTHARTAGVIVYYPKSVAQGDGI
jgi:hypothetical protein